MPGTLPAGAPGLEARGLGKDFLQPRRAQVTPVLDEVTFSVASNEFVAIVGPDRLWQDHAALPRRRDCSRRRAARSWSPAGPCQRPAGTEPSCFQSPGAAALAHHAVRNVAYGLECLQVPRRQAPRHRARAGAGWAESSSTWFERSLSASSSRAACSSVYRKLARALVFQPRILLMDEPFAALDEITREVMQDELLRLWTGSPKTVLFVTHLISEAVYLADRIVVLTGRPARVQATVTVKLPRPRDDSLRGTALFRECEAQVRALLAEDRRGAEGPGGTRRGRRQ